LAAAAVAATSSVRRYTDQVSGMAAWSSIFCMMPATFLLFLVAVMYPPYFSWSPVWKSQPNSSP